MSQTSTTTAHAAAQPSAAHALALAKRIGCKNPRTPAAGQNLGGGPQALSAIECTLSDGSTVRITTYPPAALREIQALVPTVGCRIVKPLGVTRLDAVYGEDWAVSVNSSNVSDPHPQAEAVARALGRPLTTVNCK